LKNKIKKCFEGKKILITGSTGFKGSWLSLWLDKMGAKVFGLSVDIPTKPSNYKVLNLNKTLTKNYMCDINDLNSLTKIIKDIKPDFIFHLAAQALVRKSYSNPIETFQTNSIGTLNVLNAAKENLERCNIIIITSDKAYKNKEWVWGYRENDELGGFDPYSASKAMAEIGIKSFFNSYLKDNKKIKISIGRAGNVIGGGDWAKDRLVPDIMKSWSQNETVTIRMPKATRPWQHVLEPLSGYLTQAYYLDTKKIESGEEFNFGPSIKNNSKVQDLIKELNKYWKNSKYTIKENSDFHEAGLLHLNTDKAFNYLHWEPTLNFQETIQYTAEWYKKFYDQKENMISFSIAQIDKFESSMK